MDEGDVRVNGQNTSQLLAAAEKALSQSEERYQRLFNTMTEGFCVIEVIFHDEVAVDYIFIEVNATFEEQTGLRGAVGKHILEVAPKLETHWFEFYGRVAWTGEPGRAINEVRDLGRWFDVHAYRVGKPEEHQVAVIFNDITDFKRRETALRMSEMRFRSLFDGNMDAVFLTIPDGTVTAANPAACEMLGMTEQEICRTGRQGVVAPYDDESSRLAERSRVGKIKLEQVLLHADGTRILCEVSSVIVTAGEPFSFVIAHDITNRRKTESALLQGEKIAAVGRLASSMAHEINNPLSSVENLIYLAHKSSDLDEIHRYLETAERELHRVAAITTHTLRFHRQFSNPTPIRYRDLTDSVLLLYQSRLAGSQIEVTQRYRATRTVLCFEGEIRQVINTLVSNAVDAMQAHSGRLTLHSRDGTRWKTGEKGLVLAVGDNGSGISPSVLKEIFDAFFTTKGPGGTGLGLWIAKDIMERHHGSIRVRSSNRAGRHGTVFTLFIPFDALTKVGAVTSEKL